MDDQILSKIKLVYNTLKKPGSWYTGLAIKTFLKKQFFNRLDNFNNKVISAGRWSVYAHFNQELAFQNLLDKHDLLENMSVLVHPLLPANFVDILIQRKLNIISLDIDKNTLNWDNDKLINYLRQLRSIDKQPELIIQYSFNGIIDNLIQTASEIQSLTVPNLIFIDQPQLSLNTIKLWESLEFGSVLWSAGSSFLDNQLSSVVKTNLPDKNWYFSWFLEARTKSILEYHLSQSYDYFNPILEAYFYLLLKSYQEKVWWAFFLPYLSKLVTTINFLSVQDAQNLIESSYDNLNYIALPDVIFEIENTISQNVNIIDKDLSEINHISSSFAKKLYHRISDLLPTLQSGTLEIPDFFIDKNYTEYFFYTTNQDYWNQFCIINNYSSSRFIELHSIFKDKPNLGVTNFIANYYYGIKTTV